MDPSKEHTDVNASMVDEPIENGQSMTSPYFRRSLSGQFTPAATNTNDTDWSNHSSLISRLLPFGFLCHITVQTLNELVDADIPWSNYNRFYYGESCNTDSAEFLWNSVDASVGLDHASSTEPFDGLASQRSTINSWTSAASEATQALFSSEISGAEELELALATLLTNAQNEHAEESQHLDAASWNPVGSSCFEAGSNAMSHVSDEANDARQLQTKDFKSSASLDQCPIESEKSKLVGVEMSTSHYEATDNLDIPSKGVTEVSVARQNEFTESTVLAIVLDQPSTNSPDVQGALDNESTHSLHTMDSDAVKASTGGLDCTDQLPEDQSMTTLLVGSDALVSNHNETEQVSEPPVHPSSRMELSLEEYNMLPLEIRALLEEPMLDLSLMYPTVDRFGSSIWHVLPHQFHVFKRFLCTLQPCTWPFYQTRWPPFWAPGRGATLTIADRGFFAEDEIRASSAQLRRDLFRYCRHYQLSHPNDSEFSMLIVDPLVSI
ncbi:hypothetical protein FBUS_11426 [Fasciolopsis buskii]|uniref:Uncharacterized protein n=1 Tax=Fasciolopsis buskii TaxID=27845 RepID=A0A8E0RWG0_9TREM|nr:hypothetical protein FBUS_11426 [Fasciolopsis buski]